MGNKKFLQYIAGAFFAGAAVLILMSRVSFWSLFYLVGFALIAVSLFRSLSTLMTIGAGACMVSAVRSLILFIEDIIRGGSNNFYKIHFYAALLLLAIYVILFIASLNKKKAKLFYFIAGSFAFARFLVIIIGNAITQSGTFGVGFNLLLIIGLFMIGIAADSSKSDKMSTKVAVTSNDITNSIDSETDSLKMNKFDKWLIRLFTIGTGADSSKSDKTSTKVAVTNNNITNSIDSETDTLKMNRFDKWLIELYRKYDGIISDHIKLWVGLLLASIMFFFVFIGENSLWIFALLINIVLILFPVLLFLGCMKDGQQNAALRNAEKEKKLESFRNGSYFLNPEPEMELNFYDKCIAQGITSLENQFNFQKAQLILKQFFEKESIEPDLYSPYLEKAKDYFNDGEKLRIKKNLEPKAAKLSKDQLEIIDSNEKYSNLFGRNKRETMLHDQIDKLSKLIEARKQGEKAMLELGGMLASSYSYSKPHDWALIGGAASAIGGTGAGIMAASSAMADNVEIERKNKATRDAALATYSMFANSASMANAETKDFENAKKVTEKELNNFATKLIIDDVKRDVILSALSEKSSISTDTDKVTVKLIVKNNFKSTDFADVPSNVELTVDGAYSIKLYADDNIFIETIPVALPLNGVPCGKSETITTYSKTLLTGNYSYRIEVEPTNLWVMEL